MWAIVLKGAIQNISIATYNFHKNVLSTLSYVCCTLYVRWEEDERNEIKWGGEAKRKKSSSRNRSSSILWKLFHELRNNKDSSYFDIIVILFFKLHLHLVLSFVPFTSFQFHPSTLIRSVFSIIFHLLLCYCNVMDEKMRKTRTRRIEIGNGMRKLLSCTVNDVSCVAPW